MIIINPDQTGYTFSVLTRNFVNKYEIYDEQTTIITSGITALSAFTNGIVTITIPGNFPAFTIYDAADIWKSYYESLDPFTDGLIFSSVNTGLTQKGYFRIASICNASIDYSNDFDKLIEFLNINGAIKVTLTKMTDITETLILNINNIDVGTLITDIKYYDFSGTTLYNDNWSDATIGEYNNETYIKYEYENENNLDSKRFYTLKLYNNNDLVHYSKIYCEENSNIIQVYTQNNFKEIVKSKNKYKIKNTI